MNAEFENLHQILRSLYTEMLPLCGDMIGVAKGVAGLGALFFIAAKVWQALARQSRSMSIRCCVRLLSDFASCSSPLSFWVLSIR